MQLHRHEFDIFACNCAYAKMAGVEFFNCLEVFLMFLRTFVVAGSGRCRNADGRAKRGGTN